MVDYNDVINALNNLEANRKRASININKPGITSSIPNYKTEQMFKNIGKAGRFGGIATTAIPFYKDIAFPVANDLYKGFIKGDIDNSNILRAALDLAGIDRYGNKIVKNKNKDVKQQNTVPTESLQSGLEEIDPSKMGYDMTPIQPPNNLKPLSQQQQVNNSNAVNIQPEQNNEEVVKQYVDMLQNRNAPYIKALESYLKNYPKLLEQSARNDLYFYGANLAKGLNPKAGEKFNQVKNYADMVNTVKAIQDAKNTDVDYNNELLGNMAVAQDLGLPSQAAFANKNLLTAYSMKERDAVKQAIANAQIKAKLYGIDERTALMRELQNMKGLTAENVARIYMGLDGMNPGINSIQQPTSVAPVQYPQQVSNPLGDRFKQSVGH